MTGSELERLSINQIAQRRMLATEGISGLLVYLPSRRVIWVNGQDRAVAPVRTTPRLGKPQSQLAEAFSRERSRDVDAERRNLEPLIEATQHEEADQLGPRLDLPEPVVLDGAQHRG